MTLDKAIQRCFDRCNLEGSGADVIRIMYQYKAIRELDDHEFDRVYDEIVSRLGY